MNFLQFVSSGDDPQLTFKFLFWGKNSNQEDHGRMFNSFEMFCFDLMFEQFLDHVSRHSKDIIDSNADPK